MMAMLAPMSTYARMGIVCRAWRSSAMTKIHVQMIAVTPIQAAQLPQMKRTAMTEISVPRMMFARTAHVSGTHRQIAMMEIHAQRQAVKIMRANTPSLMWRAKMEMHVQKTMCVRMVLAQVATKSHVMTGMPARWTLAILMPVAHSQIPKTHATTAMHVQRTTLAPTGHAPVAL